MSESEFPDFTLIGHKQRQILNELGSIRDDVSVLTAIALRQDSALTRLLTESRAMHSQHSRLTNRGRDLATAAEPKIR